MQVGMDIRSFFPMVLESATCGEYRISPIDGLEGVGGQCADNLPSFPAAIDKTDLISETQANSCNAFVDAYGRLQSNQEVRLQEIRSPFRRFAFGTSTQSEFSREGVVNEKPT